MATGNQLNLLWICTDSQRWDTLGCYGNPWVRTPHIDGLAAEGLQCNFTFAQNPLCQPSRGSFLTGRYPSTTRLRQNGQTCPPDLRLLPAILRDAGYTCGLSGKLHLSACDRRYELGSEWWKHNAAEWSVGREPRIDDGYTDFHWDHASRFTDPSSDYAAWLAERAYQPTLAPHADCDHVLAGADADHRQSTWCIDRAIRFMTDPAQCDRPWMYSINTFDPHYPFDPPAEALERLMPIRDEIPLPIPPAPDDPRVLPAAHRAHRDRFLERTEMDHRVLRLAYWAMCEVIDQQVGRLIAALRESGQLERTIIVFMSDHGEMLGDHGMYIKGPILLEQAVRVPLIVRMPDMASPGRQTDHLTELTDLAPTLLDLLGLPAERGMQGLSFANLLHDCACPPWRTAAYCEYGNSNPTAPAYFQTMVRTAGAKLIVHHGQDAGELYRLDSDPNEMRNLWHDPSAADLKTEMVALALNRMAWTADPLPPRIGAF